MVVVREGVDTRTIIIITMATEPQECRLRRSVVFAGETILVISVIPLKIIRNELRQLRPINYALNALNRIIRMVPATTRKTAILANRYVTIPHCVPPWYRDVPCVGDKTIPCRITGRLHRCREYTRLPDEIHEDQRHFRQLFATDVRDGKAGIEVEFNVDWSRCLQRRVFRETDRYTNELKRV